MAQSIENALKALYREHGRRLLEDDAFFLRKLEEIYQPEWKAECKVLSRAAVAGLGREASAFAGRAPTRGEKGRMKKRLMAAAPELGENEAERALAIYAAMLGWSCGPGRGMGNAEKKKWGALDIVGLVLIITGAIGIVYGMILSAQTGMTLDMIFKALDTSTMMGAMFGSSAKMTWADLLAIAVVRYRWHFLLSGLALKYIPGLWKQLKPAAR